MLLCCGSTGDLVPRYHCNTMWQYHRHHRHAYPVTLAQQHAMTIANLHAGGRDRTTEAVLAVLAVQYRVVVHYLIPASRVPCQYWTSPSNGSHVTYISTGHRLAAA
eukprot:1210604-Rhodomonas_salina.4